MNISTCFMHFASQGCTQGLLWHRRHGPRVASGKRNSNTHVCYHSLAGSCPIPRLPIVIFTILLYVLLSPSLTFCLHLLSVLKSNYSASY